MSCSSSRLSGLSQARRTRHEKKSWNQGYLGDSVAHGSGWQVSWLGAIESRVGFSRFCGSGSPAALGRSNERDKTTQMLAQSRRRPTMRHPTSHKIQPTQRTCLEWGRLLPVWFQADRLGKRPLGRLACHVCNANRADIRGPVSDIHNQTVRGPLIGRHQMQPTGCPSSK